jgi:hypothetical protein
LDGFVRDTRIAKGTTGLVANGTAGLDRTIDGTSLQVVVETDVEQITG